MFLQKFLLFFLFIYYVRCDLSSEELEAYLGDPESALLMKDAIKRAYEEDKLEMIARMVDSLKESDAKNFTLVGSQNIYGPNGDVMEVRTVELHIPQILKKNMIDLEVDDDDDENETIFEEVKTLFEKNSKLGFEMEMLMQEFDEDGEIVENAYFDKDTGYGYTEGMHFFNKTIKVANRKIVEDKIKELKSENQLTAVLKFDDKGIFLSKESTVVPELLVSIVNEDNDPETKFVDEAQNGLVTTFLKYQHNESEIPKRLSQYLNSKFADYDFYVFKSEPDSWYLTRDFKITLKYEFTGWDEDHIDYTIFGVKKEDASTSTPTTDV